jgi:putative phage-type endonuclease
MDQRTEEWFNARLGKVTASRLADLMAKTKTGYGASRENYMADLIVERLTQTPTVGFNSAAIQWGIDNEPIARQAYEEFAIVSVVEVGFVPHPAITMAGASPDGLIDDEGLVEIKCPNTATHINTFLSGNAPSKYILQMQWQMACTGRKWCDFVSYDPRMPKKYRLFIKRVERDDDKIKEMETEVVKFLTELEYKLLKLEQAVSEVANER